MVNFPNQGRIVDLTHNYSEETIYWPTEDGFKIENEFEGITEKGYFYSAKKFSAPEHGGTHIDAPIHFAKNALTVDQIPLEQLIGFGIAVDVSKNCKNNPDYQVKIDDFINWESQNGEIPHQMIVLLNTGYGSIWPDRHQYLGTEKRGVDALTELRFPGLAPESAKWLISNKKIKAIGIDTQSIDYGRSQLFETHQILCSHNIPFFENVTNVDKLPPKGFSVIALPMKIKGGSGAPLRLVSFIP